MATWISTAQTSATKADGECSAPSPAAMAVPIRTGATDAGRVLGRAARSQTKTGPGVVEAVGEFTFSPHRSFPDSRAPGELREVRLALFHERVPSFLAFLGHVEQHGGVAGEFLQPGLAVAVCVERRLEAANRDG